MAKTTHTNRGTCQVCGMLQAVDNSTGIVAKHGYVVAGWGFFNGVCPGARALPAEKDLTVTRAVMAQLTNVADSYEVDAANYRQHIKLVRTYKAWNPQTVVTHKAKTQFSSDWTSMGAYEAREITEHTPKHVVDEVQIQAAMRAEQEARNARSHVKTMNEHIVPKFGQDLKPGKDKAREWAVGDVAMIGGTRLIVERIEDAVARGCGPYMNGKLLPHLFFSKARPDGTMWQFSRPARTVRRPKD